MKHHAFSLRTVLLISCFVIAFTVAVVVDLAALLESLGLVRGLWQTTLEMGAVTTAASVIPFVAMGMSISVDGHTARRDPIQRDLKSAIDS
jgi:hypothetical protein